MSTYKENGTQEERILALLKERGSKGVMVYEFMMPRPHGLGIAQYSARIWGLRKKGHAITNKKPGFFVLEGPTAPEWEKMRVELIEKRNEKPVTIIKDTPLFG